MAYCPKCNGELDERDVVCLVCPHCGYDFPPEPDITQRRSGIAYSAWADFALFVGAVVAALVCVGFAIGSVIAVISARFIDGLLTGPVCFFLSLAMLVVFIRIQKL